jgi:hypothetical protein
MQIADLDFARLQDVINNLPFTLMGGYAAGLAAVR